MQQQRSSAAVPNRRQQVYHCPVVDCRKACKTISGLTQHLNTVHPSSDLELEEDEPQPQLGGQAAVVPDVDDNVQQLRSESMPSSGVDSRPAGESWRSPDSPTRSPSLLPSLSPPAGRSTLVDLSPLASPSSSASALQHSTDSHPSIPRTTPRSTAASDSNLPSPNQQSSPPPLSPSEASGSEHAPSLASDPDASNNARTEYHPLLDGTPCDASGYDLPPGTNHDLPAVHPQMNDVSPFDSEAHFHFADFLYSKAQMPAKKIDELLKILSALYPDVPAPFAHHREMYSVVDSIALGDIPWQSFTIRYNGEIPEDCPAWMTAEYDVWYREPLLVLEQQIANPDFAGEFDFSPKRIFDINNKRQYTDLMSGNWCWEQAVSHFLASKNYIVTVLNRIKLQRILRIMVQCLCLWS